MADEYLTEESTYADKIRMVSEDDPVLGGTKGPVNIALKGIADRTAYLKKLCADLAATIPGTAEFDRIYQEIAKLDVAKLGSEKEMIQRRINATDAEIDRLVYELYGLTEGEIAIVEGKSG